ncbi:hypothetical protein CRUP_011704 [Coryphaenoides rupestris]|nr:hypothetical protein CRUP_011704 [Coryphaenoides rupestris]
MVSRCWRSTWSPLRRSPGESQVRTCQTTLTTVSTRTRGRRTVRSRRGSAWAWRSPRWAPPPARSRSNRAERGTTKTYPACLFTPPSPTSPLRSTCTSPRQRRSRGSPPHSGPPRPSRTCHTIRNQAQQ